MRRADVKDDIFCLFHDGVRNTYQFVFKMAIQVSDARRGSGRVRGADAPDAVPLSVSSQLKRGVSPSPPAPARENFVSHLFVFGIPQNIYF